MTNKLRYISQFAVLGLLFAGSPTLAQGVVGSKHDFTIGGSAQRVTSNTDQVCIFCHTPHGADPDVKSAPLWNKVLNSNQGRFNRYSTLATPTFDSLEAPVGSVSLACLSCHDGTQAMDVVLNSPGSGNYNPAGSVIDSNISTMGGTPVPNLGEDLSNDHPISMQYAGGGASDADGIGEFQGSLGDPDFNPPIKAVLNGQSIWWVDSADPAGTALTRDKTDMLLYTRSDAVGGGGTVEPFVECGSCHDPHNSSSQGLTQVSFLRTSNAASAVCVACHTK
jgi:predicted CXXCH cytochrome family protein